MASPARPLLISPPGLKQAFTLLPPRGDGPGNPKKARQIERLAPRFTELQLALEARRGALQGDALRASTRVRDERYCEGSLRDSCPNAGARVACGRRHSRSRAQRGLLRCRPAGQTGERAAVSRALQSAGTRAAAFTLALVVRERPASKR